jgi:spore coat polysaccharide biosynthesis protein SpsF (cytidylyltransferase family)
MTVLAIVQARMGSQRFPGKMLKPLAGRPVVEWTVQRTQLAKRIDQVVIATSRRPEDDELIDWCDQHEIASFRGSENDVMDRFYQCAKLYNADYVVRLTGDCPLLDPRLIDTVTDLCLHDESVDYASNVEPMTYPEGMSVEVMPFRALECAWRESTLPSHREHVTPFLRFHPERFKHAVLLAQPSLQHYRFTVDYAADLEAIEHLISRLQAQGIAADFSLDDVLQVIDNHPEIAQVLNAKARDLWRQEVMRDEGWSDKEPISVLTTDSLR